MASLVTDYDIQPTRHKTELQPVEPNGSLGLSDATRALHPFFVPFFYAPGQRLEGCTEALFSPSKKRTAQTGLLRCPVKELLHHSAVSPVHELRDG